ncbi:hypothetical protein PY092_17750 [Muricauda sp. 334s03]|uniref:DUF1735 domain-containing protein n=1 Tax=Flagellimonas yonaguniensis TaxID=3031325 RepID=A0ABT5Y3H9_9FLAO|nr:hypothetical protein [[Muricauda] yonaguniensis]MDF0718013.1 hypothetical protein [[Muricauda] yonaguniensis]
MPKKLFLLLVTILSISCKSDDDSMDLNCAAVFCAAVDDTLYLQFLNPENDDDLLDNGAIDTNLMEIVNEKNQEITFTIEEYPDMGMFLAIPVSKESFRQQSFTIDFEEGDSFTIHLETSFPKGEGCCGPYTTLENFNIDHYSYELVEPSPFPVFSTVYIPNLN